MFKILTFYHSGYFFIPKCCIFKDNFLTKKITDDFSTVKNLGEGAIASPAHFSGHDITGLICVF